DLLRFSSGFGWDKDTKKFTAPNEVWNEYLQVDNLLKVYGQNIAKGNNTVGLGDTTNARTYIARDNDGDDENDGDADADDDGDDDDGIVSMIQQRWQKEAEEKEAEEKVNNVWDVIKEIPDLEENERFDAMNLVHQLGMKAGFMSMTRQERFRWIKRSVRKP
ncbi:unnamed protein product, partial [Brassica oleracea var. botrytis]